MQHVGISCSSLQAADLFITGLKGSCEVVNAGAGGSELLGGDGGALLHCGSESIGHRACDFNELVSTEINEGFG